MNDDLSLRVRRLHVRSRRLVESFFAGNYHSVFKGSGLEYDEVREYEYGDDIRFIDWNVSSRMTAPYTKTFKEERELVLFMVVDVSASLAFGSGGEDKRSTAGTIFALLSLAAEANNDKVGSLLFTDRVEKISVPSKGRRPVLRQISEVLGYKPQGRGSNMEEALRTAFQTLKRRSIVIILSDFRMAGYQTELALLSRKHDVIAVNITDPLEGKFPLLGLTEMKDPENGECIISWGSSSLLSRDYERFWKEHRNRWHNSCRSVGADTLEVSTEDDPAVRLQAFFKKRRDV
ncbi:MAG: hypothetical protein B0D92_02895 [Spirochaeta sp. LUC14_002_19_P3]|nr:MAG: hypothetical protein B0D92_02895 [Spirochaeta sp. LUC14_002_19_P3]